MKIICIIPARLASTRFPRKVLSSVAGKPILQWIWETACHYEAFDDVAFAIDSEETAKLIETFKGHYFMTSPTCPSGTDRLIELMQSKKMQGDIWVNWQGDSPCLKRALLDDLIYMIQTTHSDVWTLKYHINKQEDILNPHIVKVVTNAADEALYFSRSPIPYPRDKETTPPYYKHIGIYAYTQEALSQIAHLPPSPLEKIEMLEQLRYLEHGMTIKVHETHSPHFEIDHPEDILQASKHLELLKQSQETMR